MTDFGGDKRDRTADLLLAKQALSQLSYTPISHKAPLKEKSPFGECSANLKN